MTSADAERKTTTPADAQDQRPPQEIVDTDAGLPPTPMPIPVIERPPYQTLLVWSTRDNTVALRDPSRDRTQSRAYRDMVARWSPLPPTSRSGSGSGSAEVSADVSHDCDHDQDQKSADPAERTTTSTSTSSSRSCCPCPGRAGPAALQQALYESGPPRESTHRPLPVPLSRGPKKSDPDDTTGLCARFQQSLTLEPLAAVPTTANTDGTRPPPQDDSAPQRQWETATATTTNSRETPPAAAAAVATRLCADIWFSVFRALAVGEVVTFQRISRELGAAARMALARLEVLDLWCFETPWHAPVAAAVLRAGCRSLRELQVSGKIDAVGKIVHAAPHLEAVRGLAPNLLSRHLTRDVPSLTSLSLWVDAAYSDDLSIVAARLKNLRRLQITATSGLTVYDQQLGAVLRACTRLESLQLGAITLTDDLVAHFAALPRLRALRLQDARLTDAVLGALLDALERAAATSTSTSQQVAPLRTLSIRHNPVTPSGVAAIGRCARLRASLAELELSHAGDIYAGTFHMVCDRGFLPALRQLRVAPRVRAVFARQMAKTRPGVGVNARALCYS